MEGSPSVQAPQRSPLDQIRVIRKLGLKMIKLAPVACACYFLSSLLAQAALLAAPILAAELTNSRVSAPPSGSHVHATTFDIPMVWFYFYWLALTLGAIIIALLARAAQFTVDARMEHDVRVTLLDQVCHHAPDFFRKYKPGELTSAVTQSVGETVQAVRNLTIEPVIQAFSLCAASVLVFEQIRESHNSSLWPVVALILCFGGFSTWLLQKKAGTSAYATYAAVQEQRFRTLAVVESAVTSAEEIQVMNAESRFRMGYDKVLTDYFRTRRRQTLFMESVQSAMGLQSQAVLAVLYGVVVFQAVHSTAALKPGVFIALAGLVPQLMLPFKMFATLGIVLNSSWPAVELVDRMLKDHPRIADVAGASRLSTLELPLEVSKVSFAYPGSGKKVFSNLTFSLSFSAVVGVVGTLGEGKTTLFRLFLRIYDPDSGEIRIGGKSIQSIRLDSLRQQIALMTQAPAFVPGSVRENFRFAQPGITDREIEAVSEKTGLWHILRTNFGLEPLDADFAGGRTLSGGQRRLFALARCLSRNPSFLLLDEPGANLDNVEKHALIPNIRAAGAGRIVFVVDHDIRWLTKLCDHFIVLKDGAVVEHGDWETLNAAEGVFAQLYTDKDCPKPDSATSSAETLFPR